MSWALWGWIYGWIQGWQYGLVRENPAHSRKTAFAVSLLWPLVLGLACLAGAIYMITGQGPIWIGRSLDRLVIEKDSE